MKKFLFFILISAVCIQVNGQDIEGTYIKKFPDSESYAKVTFNADSTFLYEYKLSWGKYVEEGTYVRQGNTIKLPFSNSSYTFLKIKEKNGEIAFKELGRFYEPIKRIFMDKELKYYLKVKKKNNGNK